jgi:hypothetical protein
MKGGLVRRLCGSRRTLATVKLNDLRRAGDFRARVNLARLVVKNSSMYPAG